MYEREARYNVERIKREQYILCLLCRFCAVHYMKISLPTCTYTVLRAHLFWIFEINFKDASHFCMWKRQKMLCIILWYSLVLTLTINFSYSLFFLNISLLLHIRYCVPNFFLCLLYVNFEGFHVVCSVQSKNNDDRRDISRPSEVFGFLFYIKMY